MPPSHHDDSLSRTLATWRVQPARNPQFRTQVWAKIDAARRPSTWTAFARAHAALVTSALTAAVLLGAWSGRNEARERHEADRATLAATYVHALDARWQRLP